MTNRERAILAAAWLLIGTAAVAGPWSVSKRPKVHSAIAAAEKAILKGRGSIVCGAPTPVWFHPPKVDPKAGTAPAHDWAPFLLPRWVGRSKATVGPRRTVEALPLPVIYSEKADLKGVTIAWGRVCRRVVVTAEEVHKEGEVKGLVIERAGPDGEFRPIAPLGPDVEAYFDATAEHRTAYRYRVRVDGYETRIRGENYVRERVLTEGAVTGVIRTPSPYRVKLVGGDAKLGLLRVETYQRDKDAWTAKDHPVRPGGAIGPTGWTLEALRFDRSTLTAEVKDDLGQGKRITTKD